jgi:hypothetical protein
MTTFPVRSVPIQFSTSERAFGQSRQPARAASVEIQLSLAGHGLIRLILADSIQPPGHFAGVFQP